MIIEKTFIEDLFLLRRQINFDERGSFSRLFNHSEITSTGVFDKPVHINTSHSIHAGTLRGIHFQYPPFEEAKLVACVKGAVWDVGVDLRPFSKTRFKSFGVELTASNGVQLLIPKGFGHAFMTLEPNTVLVYMVSEIYNPKFESGLKYNDPTLAIEWPRSPTVVSSKDRSWDFLENRLDEFDKIQQ